MTETSGDHYNVECPYCGKNNHFVPQHAGTQVPQEGKISFVHPCKECKKAVHYVARRSHKDGFPIILLQASTDESQG